MTPVQKQKHVCEIKREKKQKQKDVINKSKTANLDQVHKHGFLQIADRSSSRCTVRGS